MKPVTDMAQALAALHAEAFATPWSAEAFAGLLAQQSVMLEVAPDGFLLVQAAVDEAEILTLAVRPAARRKGVATSLLAAAVRRLIALDIGRLFLEVAEDNPGALALYGRLGFESVGRRTRYYARPDGSAVDALLLARNLSAPLPSA